MVTSVVGNVRSQDVVVPVMGGVGSLDVTASR